MGKRISLLIVTLTLLSLIMPIDRVHAESTTIRVDPPTSTVEVEKTFAVNITVTDVTDLAVWEVQLYYLNTILNCTNAAKGLFLEKDGNPQFFTFKINNAYNATHGYILTGATLMGPVPGVNGSGTLATVTFQAKAVGETPLHLTGTTLKDSTRPPRHPIPHTTVDGTVTVVHALGVHDVAVTNVKLGKTIVGEGFPIRINVTVENIGNFSETFNTTLNRYPPATQIGVQLVSPPLAPNEVKVLTFLWGTTGVIKANYTIGAYATPVSGETDTSDNNCTGGTILVTIPGDINGDRKVDGKDIAIAAKAFGTRIGQPNFTPNADINSDGKIDGKDIAIAASNFGKSWR